MSNLDTRALIPLDYKQMDTEELLELKRSIMHTMIVNSRSNEALHREHNSIRLVLATRNLNETEAEPQTQKLPTNADLLEPEYVAWQVKDGEAS